MNISEVMDYTGLTRKAIRYYEQEGLIQPQVNESNQYRDYSMDDVNLLTQIAVLRQLDLGVREIRQILGSPTEWRRVLESHHQKLAEELKQVEQSKHVIEVCLQTLATDCDPTVLARQLVVLNQSLELSNKDREGYMFQALTRIFPGYFGKMMIAHFGPFLQESIDSAEKECAWLDLVAFLDGMPEIEYPEAMKVMYDQLPEDYMISFQEHEAQLQKKLISPTEEDLKEQKRVVDEFIHTLQEDPEFRTAYEESVSTRKVLQEQLVQSGYYEKFVENLKVLSNDYRKYHQTLAKLGEKLDLSEIERIYHNVE